MGLNKHVAQILALFLIINSGIAQETYTVKSGDILSLLVKTRYPHERLYGKRGKMAEVLKYNPHIKNPHKIFPNLKIHFAPENVIELKRDIAVVSPVAAPEVEVKPDLPLEEVGQHKGLDQWNISAQNGFKYVSVTQSGVAGKSEVGVLLSNAFKLNSEFLFDDWSLGVQIDSYKFKLGTLSAGDSKQMSALNLFGSYNWFLGGLTVEQSPLFRNNNGDTEMSRMTLLYLTLGAKKDIELPTTRPTFLKFKGWLGRPLSASSDSPSIRLNSLQGYGLFAQVELSRQISAKDHYSLHAVWSNQLSTQQVNQQVKWDTSSGGVKSTLVNASTSLGLQLTL